MMADQNKKFLDQLKYQKNELLAVLESNRVKHIETYNEAFKTYKEELKEELLSKLRELETGKIPATHSELVMPASFVSSYDTAIRMFQLCTDETIVLDRMDFSQFIMDEWDWKHTFHANTMSYSLKNKR